MLVLKRQADEKQTTLNEMNDKEKEIDVRSCDKKIFENVNEECVMNERRKEKKIPVEKDVDKPVRTSGRVVKKPRRLLKKIEYLMKVTHANLLHLIFHFEEERCNGPFQSSIVGSPKCTQCVYACHHLEKWKE